MVKNRFCVYPAGPISSDHAIGFLTNIRHGLALTRELMLLGFSVFPTFADFVMSLQGYIPLEMYYQNSMGWLERADAVSVQTTTRGYLESKGTQAEIARAKELNIPVFYSVTELEEHYGKIQNAARGA